MIELAEMIKLDIRRSSDVLQLLNDLDREQPRYCAFDTETNGLNIKFHKPFLMTFGFLSNDFKRVYTYALDLEQNTRRFCETVYKIFLFMVRKSEKTFGQHVVYDLHMLDNVDFEKPPFEKLSDTQFYIRLANDAVQVDEGGPPLELKMYAQRYITPDARYSETVLKEEIKQKRADVSKRLLQELRKHPMLPELRITGHERTWTAAMVEEYVDDNMKEIDDLPEPYRTIVRDFEQEYEDCYNYQKLNRENVTFYAHYDIFYTLHVFLETKDRLFVRGQQQTLEREEKAMEGFYLMEKTPKIFDVEYAKKMKGILKTYIQDMRKRLCELSGIDLSVGQSKVIKQLFADDYKILLESSDKKAMHGVVVHPDTSDEAKELATIITRLRSIEKWYATYLVKWIAEVERFGTNELYPQFKQVGTVTGRASSAFQQFPHDAMMSLDKQEIFHPRQMFVAPKGKSIFYVDYSSMEMRLQAIYTLLIGCGDVNLCRVYIPYQCHKVEDKWYYDEDPTKEWQPYDPHAATAMAAFGITKDAPDFPAKRSLGKRGNFAIIYGASPQKIAVGIGVTLAQATAIYKTFYNFFPRVQDYVDYVRRHLEKYGYAQNFLGRRYYNINAHKGRNYLIQGAGADYTKECLIDLVALFRNRKSKLLDYLHDEFMVLIEDDERDELVPKIRAIMEQLDTPIKMIVEVSSTTTTWRDKRAYGDAS